MNRLASLLTGATLTALFSLGAVATALAAPGITITGGTPTTAFPNRTEGFEFSTGVNGFTITSLGYWDEGAAGLLESHQVAIWTGDGLTLLASATVGAGTSGFLDSGFRFVDIADVFLAANSSFLAGGFTGSAGDAITRFATATTVAGITLGSSRFDVTGAFTAPNETQGDTFDDGYFGPNFNGALAETGGVPEPATWGLMIMGFGGIGALLRRRRGVASLAKVTTSAPAWEGAIPNLGGLGHQRESFSQALPRT